MCHVTSFGLFQWLSAVCKVCTVVHLQTHEPAADGETVGDRRDADGWWETGETDGERRRERDGGREAGEKWRRRDAGRQNER